MGSLPPCIRQYSLVTFSVYIIITVAYFVYVIHILPCNLSDTFYGYLFRIPCINYHNDSGIDGILSPSAIFRIYPAETLQTPAYLEPGHDFFKGKGKRGESIHMKLF